MRRLISILILSLFVGLPCLAFSANRGTHGFTTPGFGVSRPTATAVDTNASQFTAANSEFLSRTDDASLSTGDIDWSIVGWIYGDSFPNPAPIVTKYTADAGVKEYLLRVNASDIVDWTVYDSSNGSIGTATEGTVGALSTGTWYFVYAYHDATANTLGVSVNNNAVATTATGGTAPGDQDAAFRIGNATGATYLFDGRMQSVGFAKSVLAAGTVTSLYNSGVPKGWCQLTGAEQALFTGWWDLGEASGNRSDSTANALTLTDNNTVTGNTGTRTGNCN